MSAHPNIHFYHSADSNSIFDAMNKSKKPKETRLMADVSELRRTENEDEIDKISWLRSCENPADGLNRSGINRVLKIALKTRKLKNATGQ